MNKLIIGAMALAILTSCGVRQNDSNNKTEENMEQLKLTFTPAENVRREKVHFKNRFGIELTGDMYIPTSLKAGERTHAVAVCGPFGAVKEQASGYWANHP